MVARCLTLCFLYIYYLFQAWSQYRSFIGRFYLFSFFQSMAVRCFRWNQILNDSRLLGSPRLACNTPNSIYKNLESWRPKDLVVWLFVCWTTQVFRTTERLCCLFVCVLFLCWPPGQIGQSHGWDTSNNRKTCCLFACRMTGIFRRTERAFCLFVCCWPDLLNELVKRRTEFFSYDRKTSLFLWLSVVVVCLNNWDTSNGRKTRCLFACRRTTGIICTTERPCWWFVFLCCCVDLLNEFVERTTVIFRTTERPCWWFVSLLLLCWPLEQIRRTHISPSFGRSLKQIGYIRLNPQTNWLHPPKSTNKIQEPTGILNTTYLLIIPGHEKQQTHSFHWFGRW